VPETHVTSAITFSNKLLVRAFVVYVTPVLEHVSIIWSSQWKQHIQTWESSGTLSPTKTV